MKLPKILKFKKFTLATTLLIVSLSLLLGTKALAQETQRTFTVAYPVLTHKLNPGQRAEGITKVINDSSSPLIFNLSVQDFIVDDNLGTPSLLPPNTLSQKYSASAWIGVTPSTFTLQPGAQQVINYYIQVPSNGRPGGHYAAIVYTPVVTKGAQGTGGTVNAQVGSIFYITINGPIKENSFVSKFLSNPFQEYGPVTVNSQIRNLGDLHIKPKGTIQVSGLLFNKTQDLASYNIFPGAARDFENTFGGQTFMFGRYKAVLLASYGVNNNLPLTATLYFWVIPWRLILVLILIAVAIILSALYFKKRSKKSKEQPVNPVEEKPEEIKPQV
jgi:hypothetical protein